MTKKTFQGQPRKMVGRLITYKGTPIRLSVDSSAETFVGQEEVSGILKIFKDKTVN